MIGISAHSPDPGPSPSSSDVPDLGRTEIEEVLRLAPHADAASVPVAVLLISFDTTEQTLRCIESLRSQTRPPAWIGVLDNDPARGELRDAIDGIAPFAASELRLFRSDRNLGFAAGCNALIECYLAVESCRHFLLLNNDAVALPHLVERLTDAISQDARAGMVGGRMHRLDAPEQVDTLGISLYASLMPADRYDIGDAYLGPTGGCAMISRECAQALEESVGYVFDGRFFCYCEDTDVALRANLLGFRPLFVDDVVALHEGQASSGGPDNLFIVYHGLRNSCWMVMKSIPARLLWKYGALFLLAHLMSVARHVVSGRPGLVFRVYRDALRGLPGVREDRRRLSGKVRLPAEVLEERICQRFYRRGYFRAALRKALG
jgi:GT2 family glycosyltransferase